jgi:hypothetical protein
MEKGSRGDDSAPTRGVRDIGRATMSISRNTSERLA